MAPERQKGTIVYPVQQQQELQHTSAEWCEHDKPILIHRKGDTPVQSRITFAGRTAQDNVDALPSPSGHIDRDGNLVINVQAPAFDWACTIVVRWGQQRYAHLAYGNVNCPLTPGADMKIVVNLP